MNVQSISRFGVSALSAGLSIALLGVVLGPAYLDAGGAQSKTAKGRSFSSDSTMTGKTTWRFRRGAVANQSLNRTDVLDGGSGNDVMFGLNGNDVMDGGPGRDIILGGPDGGPAPGGPPNSDIMFGGPGDDVNLWAPGDGSEAFIGGQGAMRSFSARPIATNFRIRRRVFGCRPCCSAVPGFPQGIPTADVSGLSNFCTLEESPSPDYQYLVRFRGAAGNIIVTVRVSDVEQVFCSQGGGIAFADLTDPSPAFAVVSPQEVETLNSLVGAMIR